MEPFIGSPVCLPGGGYVENANVVAVGEVESCPHVMYISYVNIMYRPLSSYGSISAWCQSVVVVKSSL